MKKLVEVEKVYATIETIEVEFPIYRKTICQMEKPDTHLAEFSRIDANGREVKICKITIPCRQVTYSFAVLDGQTLSASEYDLGMGQFKCTKGEFDDALAELQHALMEMVQ